jgi:hypothetical protein
MAWKIEPEGKKSIVDVEYYAKRLKNGKELTLRKEVGYRWGHIIVEEDPRPAIQEAEANNTGYICVSELGEIDHEYTDGCWSDYIDLDELPKRERTKLEEAFWPEDAGWEFYESETNFYGDLTVTQVSDSYPYNEIDEIVEDNEDTD